MIPLGGFMGQMDRDYWRDRYNKKATGSRDPTHWREDELQEANRYEPAQARPVPRRSAESNELSFIGKLFTTIFVMLICAVIYRYAR